ncbi:hypothetical protein [Streptomyces sp. NPDC001348]
MTNHFGDRPPEFVTTPTLPPPVPRSSPPLAAAAATAVVPLAARAPVAGRSWAPLPASLAIAAPTICLVLALRTRRGPSG